MKTHFLQWGFTGYIHHTSGQAPILGIVDQHKRSSLIFWGTFCFILLNYSDFRFCGFAFLVFCLFEREGEIKNISWIVMRGEDMKRIWEGKNMIKI